MTPGTASTGTARHPDRAGQRHREESTMRHALVPVRLIHSARTAAATYARYDDGPDSDETYVHPSRRVRRPRRFAARARRTHH